MSAHSLITFQSPAKIAWLTMLTITVLATLNHLILIFVIPEEATLFIGWAAYTAYAAVVLFIPFRRGETWAWYTTWILAIGFASMGFLDAQVGMWYSAAGVIMAGCLMLTRGAFFSKA
ncbi:MAG: hypothetical protein JNL09_09410 [Anaerolineales bacterium]|nr:hypothetical protein [Anaerolineales bacterium]